MGYFSWVPAQTADDSRFGPKSLYWCCSPITRSPDHARSPDLLSSLQPSLHNVPYYTRALLVRAAAAVRSVVSGGDESHLSRRQLTSDSVDLSRFGSRIAFTVDDGDGSRDFAETPVVKVRRAGIGGASDLDPGLAVAANGISPMRFAVIMSKHGYGPLAQAVRIAC